MIGEECSWKVSVTIGCCDRRRMQKNGEGTTRWRQLGRNHQVENSLHHTELRLKKLKMFSLKQYSHNAVTILCMFIIKMKIAARRSWFVKKIANFTLIQYSKLDHSIRSGELKYLTCF